MKARTPRPALRYALHSVLRSVLYSVPRPALSARRITAAASLGLRLRRRAGPGAAGFCLLNCIFIRCTFRF